MFDGILENCTLCPHMCGTNRKNSFSGYCGTGDGYSIASIVVHKGEEPVISGAKGICNVFFTGCNLKCIYCQNYQISRAKSSKNFLELDQIVGKIITILDSGIHAVGFVSTSHVVPQVVEIIGALHKRGYHPTIVYNTNAYEYPETIKRLEGLIDVYLPDYKYFNPEISKKYSGIDNYNHFAFKVIKEMYRQKGSTLFVDDNGQAESGLLIRHLVLPGHTNDTINILNQIANEISTGVHISLMSQYYPADKAINHPNLGRMLYVDEYQIVVDEMQKLGFRNGWIQQMESSANYRPDFSKKTPFNN